MLTLFLEEGPLNLHGSIKAAGAEFSAHLDHLNAELKDVEQELTARLKDELDELDVENIAALTAERDAIKHQMDVADHRVDCAERIVAKLDRNRKVLTLTGSEARFLRTYLQWHAGQWRDIVRIPNWPGDKRTVRKALRQGDAILARLEA
ncbi:MULTISPECIES: hypothetical protein [unclassified Aeromonas]|uniref:hypothetical protein n=1 Tax=unclassified Aeromonas TaxID=257493 RepID=UPI0022E0A8AD|nr:MULTISPECIES: hypothetical protein [unclassified Aeromonas]